MTRTTIYALLGVALVLGSGPALPVAGAPTSSDDATTEPVIVRNAEVGTVQAGDSTVENVTIRVLRIDRMTIQNETGDGQLNEALGAGGDEPVVFRNVHFRNLSLENTSAEGLTLSGQGAQPTTPGGPEPTPDETSDTVTAQVGNVSGAVISEMTVDQLVVEQANVSEGDGDVVGDIVERISGLFGGDGGGAANETVAQPDLRVATVDVSRLTVEQLDVAQVQEAEQAAEETPTNQTGEQTPGTPGGGADGTILGQVSVENATIGTLSADAMTYQQAAETETPAANESSPSS